MRLRGVPTGRARDSSAWIVALLLVPRNKPQVTDDQLMEAAKTVVGRL